MINVGADSVSAQIGQIQQKEDNLFEKLASGKKVNSALDEAAAQQIIDRFTTQVEGNRQAIKNLYDGISVAQIAEGGLSTINDDVNRIRELSLQSGSGILNDSDRRAIQSEITQLQKNIVQSLPPSSTMCSLSILRRVPVSRTHLTPPTLHLKALAAHVASLGLA